ncbi:hypothetical protein AB0D35_26700 [Streptomyces sp. NPDC048301]|uniref:hypothetical protein n=1 Tax=unclassified Streptomyces TaxID=2593676 RepID=UPI00341221A4
MLQQSHRPTPPAAEPAAVRPSVETGPVALLLGATAPHHHPGEAAVTAALLETWSSGVTTWVVDRPELLAARGPEARVLADMATGLDSLDAAACAAWARDSAARGHRFDLVLGLSEDVQTAAAEVAAALHLPGNHPEAVRTVQDADARRAALVAGGFLVDEDPDRAPEGIAVTSVGAFVSGRPHVFLLASPAKNGWTGVGPLPRSPRQVAAESAAAAAHLGLCFGLFRVDLRVTDRGIAVTDVRLSLEAPGLRAHVDATLPGVEFLSLVYDDALGRTAPLPATPLAPAPEPRPPAPAAPGVAPFALLAGEPAGAAAEPHICRGID